MRLHLLSALVLMTAAALTGCKSDPPPMPLAELNPQQIRGHADFQTRCALCHYDRKSGPLNGPSMLGVFKKSSLPSGAAATDERVTATILHGRNNMPALGNQLDPADVYDILAYLHTL